MREKYNRGEGFVHLAKLLSINQTMAYFIVLTDKDAAALAEKDIRSLMVTCEIT